jgi:septum site-determining protein MinD
MAKVLVVTSGKGGVGKTTSTAALGAALAKAGQNVVVVDFDVGLRNLDLVMGAERRVVYDLINVVQGDAKLPQALIRDKRIDTLCLLPASQTRDKDALSERASPGDAGTARKIRLGDLRQPGRHRARRAARDAPCRRRRGGDEPGSLLGARLGPHHRPARRQDREAEKGERIEKHLLLTRYDPGRAERGDMLKVEDVLEILSIPLLGIIPESAEVLRASNLGTPVTLSSETSAPARAYMDAARRLKGETVAMAVPSERKGMFGKLFTRRAA